MAVIQSRPAEVSRPVRLSPRRPAQGGGTAGRGRLAEGSRTIAAFAAAGVVADLAGWWTTGWVAYPAGAAGIVVAAVGLWRGRRVLGLLASLAAAAALAVELMAAARPLPGGWTGTTVSGLLILAQVAQVSSAGVPRDLLFGTPIALGVALQAAFRSPSVGGLAVAGVLGCLVAGLAAVPTRRLASVGVRVGLVAAVIVLGTPDSLHLRLSGHPAGGTPAASVPPSPGPGGAADGTSAGIGAHAAALLGTGGLDLAVRGALPPVPLAAVPADAPVYWRGMVYDAFDGRRWSVSGDAAGAWTASRPTSQPPAAPAVPDGPRRTDTVDLLGPPVGVLLTPGEAVGYAGPGTLVADGDGNALPREGLTGQYAVTSVVTAGPVTGVARAAPGVAAKWTALPATLSPQVAALAATLARPTRAATVDAVRTYLQSHERYRLDPPASPSGDPVAAFLFRTHEGFCEQFATAEVVLLRAVGVPARLVTGVAFGEVQDGRRIFRASDAHAWVQVWYPGVGWVNDDPTPPSALGAAPPGVSSGPSLTAGGPAHKAEAPPAESAAPSLTAGGAATATPSPAGQPTVQPPRRPSAAGAGRFAWNLLLAGALLGLLAVWAVARRLRGRARRIGAPAPDVSVPSERSDGYVGGGPVLRAYRDFAEAVGGSADCTPREVVARLGPAIADAPEVLAALGTLDEECFGIEPPSPVRVQAAVQVFSRLRSMSGLR